MIATNRIVAIIGGIGSGKSVVCRALQAMGYPVYDCDSRAKMIMDGSDELKRSLADIFGADVVADGVINRKLLSQIVFSNPDKLMQLNALVHGEVRKDIADWISRGEGLMFIETAILYQSGLDKMVDEVWDVTAPKEIRLQRAAQRDNSSAEAIACRIESQDSYVVKESHRNVRTIENDGFKPLLPQLLALIAR